MPLRQIAHHRSPEEILAERVVTPKPAGIDCGGHDREGERIGIVSVTVSAYQSRRPCKSLSDAVVAVTQRCCEPIVTVSEFLCTGTFIAAELRLDADRVAC